MHIWKDYLTAEQNAEINSEIDRIISAIIEKSGTSITPQEVGGYSTPPGSRPPLPKTGTGVNRRES
ncbi:hypothetical protein [Methylosinus sp. PW1]|uniref:hypothetical protein n=1 Tax=Methylosinus sp. PW1 TaxID=107636 RepID=UPI00055AB9B1|nr:hypothetical protein [Methylosinus sp. PW1]